MSAKFQQFAVGADVVSLVVFRPMPGRKYLSFQNQDAAAILYVRINAPAEANASSTKISPGGFYELRDPCAEEEINIIATAATQNINVVEGVDYAAAV